MRVHSVSLAFVLALTGVGGLLYVFGQPQIYPPTIGKSYAEDARPTFKQKQWALATCAMLTQFNRRSHDVLGGHTEPDDGGKKSLREGWGVHNRSQLIKVLKWIECGGHRKGYEACVAYLESSPAERRALERPSVSADAHTRRAQLDQVKVIHSKFAKAGLTGWDFSRYVSLCGWGFHAGYLSEEEAWSRIMPVARLLQGTFSSWDELGENYLEGRRFWAPFKSKKNDDEMAEALHFLRWSSYSPWARLKWNMSLLPEKQKDDGSKEFFMGKSWYFWFGNSGYKEKAKDCYAEAVNWFTRAAEKGNADAMFWLGLCCEFGRGVPADQAKAFAWYQKAAQAGDGWAHYQLGLTYYYKRGPQKNKELIAWHFEQAVTNGCGPKAEVFLGWCCETGYGVEKSIEKAKNLYVGAAKREEPWAQVSLGDFYLKGFGFEKNLSEAAYWFKRSAINGNQDGMCYWAQCLERGEGVKKDSTESLLWYRKSAEKGCGRAKKRLAELERSTTSDKIQ